MAQTNSPTTLRSGSRVTVLGKLGTLIWFNAVEAHVRLDGEGQRVDIWHRSQVEVAS